MTAHVLSKQGSPYLGISAKSSHAKAEKLLNSDTALGMRQKRYLLQRTAQSLLFDYNATKQHRVCSCHRNVAGESVPLYRLVDGSDSRLGGLVTCGSVWSCPVCNAKITEARREDMQKASTAWQLQGGACLLNTLTFPHEADMPLDELVEKFSKALDLYKKSRTYNRIFGTAMAAVEQRNKKVAANPEKYKPLRDIRQGIYQRLGTVRSLEVTHGVNGWHPHVHEVYFMDNDELNAGTETNKKNYADSVLDKAKFHRDELTSLWVQCLIESGLGDKSKINEMLQHSWDIRGGDYVSDYINKFGREPVELRGWTIASEVTKANSKIGNRRLGGDWHNTPFQLLGFATDGDAAAGALFKEFSICFEGKRMNYWSNGLKDWFGINEADDETLAEDMPVQVEEEIVLYLNPQEWRMILQRNARAELLHVAAEFGKEGVLKLLDELPDRKATHSGHYKVNRPKGIWT